jgi:transcriptional regulator NrdR family protein
MTKKKEVIIQDNKSAVQSNSDKVLDGLINAMASGNLSPDALEKMLDMQERILDRQAKVDFNEAFTKLKSELSPIVNNAKSHTNRYSTIDHIQKTISAPLSKNGFTIRWDATKTAESIEAECFISHVSGHEKSAKAFAVIESTSKATNASQAVAMATSYAKRYSLLNALGLTTTNEDNDANYPQETIDEEKQKVIQAMLVDSDSNEVKFFAYLGVGSISEIPVSKYQQAINALSAKINKQNDEVA